MPGEEVATLVPAVVVQQPPATVVGSCVERPRAAASAVPALQPPAAPPLADFPSCQSSPFGAVAALLADSLARAEQSGGTFTRVDICWEAAPQAAAPPATQSATQPGGAAPPAAQQQRQHHQQQQQPVLVVDDDAAGLSPQQLRRSIGVPLGDCCRSGSAVGRGPRGSSWPGFVHAALRLGSAALVLTKRKGRGGSAALLLCHADGGGGEGVVAALVDWNAEWRPVPASATQAQPGGGSAAAAAACDTTWPAALAAVCRGWPGGCSREWLLQQLAAMPEQGTRVLVTSLRSSRSSSGDRAAAAAAGEAAPVAPAAASGAAAASTEPFELDWQADHSDICVRAAGAAQHAGAPAAAAGQRSEQPGSPAQQMAPEPALWRRPAAHTSLRSFLGLLFLRWPDGFRLRLRGSDVTHYWQQLTSDARQWGFRATEDYRPRGVKDAVDEHGYLMQHIISVHLGTVACAEGQQGGICFYHGNRLVRAFWRPPSWPAPCAAVVGFLESDALTPTTNWQDFEPSPVLQKLEAFVKRAVPAYCDRRPPLAPPPAHGPPPPAHAARQLATTSAMVPAPQQWESGQQPGWLSTLSMVAGLGAGGATAGAAASPPAQLDSGTMAALAAAAAAHTKPVPAPESPQANAQALQALLSALLPAQPRPAAAPALLPAAGDQQAFNQLLLQTVAQLLQALQKHEQQQHAMQLEMSSLRQLLLASAPLERLSQHQSAGQQAAQQQATQQQAAQQQATQQEPTQQQATQQQHAAQLSVQLQVAQQAAQQQAMQGLVQKASMLHWQSLQQQQHPHQERAQAAALSLTQLAQRALAMATGAGGETNAHKRTRLG